MIHSDLVWVFDGCDIDFRHTEDKKFPHVLVKSMIHKEVLDALKVVEDIFTKQKAIGYSWDSYNETTLEQIRQAIAMMEQQAILIKW